MPHRAEWRGPSRRILPSCSSISTASRSSTTRSDTGSAICLLQAVGESLKKALQDGEVLARLGGDEFAIVVPTVDGRASLEALANRLTELVSQPYEIDGHRILSSVSIGIALGPHDGDNSDDLLKAADLALYAVKATSRGTFRFYNRAMNEEVNDRRQIEMDLREAIEHNELELHYQPIVDLQRNVITGFEALARWRHPVKGMVPPSVFIPVAEDSGLILPLGEWALREACRQRGQVARASADRRQPFAGAVLGAQPVRNDRSGARGNRPGAAPARARNHRADHSWRTARRRCRTCAG